MEPTPERRLVPVPDTTEIDTKTNTTVEVANEIVISTPKDYVAVTDFLKDIKALQKEVENTFNEPIQAAHRAHKAVLEAKRKHMEPLKRAEDVIKEKITKYRALEEGKRREEEKKLLAARREMIEQEKEDQAAALERDGREQEAEMVRNMPTAPTPAVVLPDATPRVHGISTRKAWKYRITNDRLIPREYLMVDEKKIAGIVRMMKGETNIPGIEVFPEEVISARK